MAMADLFLLQRGEVEAVKALAVPGWPHEELGGGRRNQEQKLARCRLLAVDGLLRSVRPNQR
jgi:hypothetical protein